MIQTSSRGSENGGAFESTSPFKATKKGTTAFGRHHSQDPNDLTGQLQYANDVFKDASVLQSKLQNQMQINDNLRKDLF